MDTTCERGNEKSLSKTLSETIGLIVVLYCVYLFGCLEARGYINNLMLPKVLLNFWPE